MSFLKIPLRGRQREVFFRFNNKKCNKNIYNQFIKKRKDLLVQKNSAQWGASEASPISVVTRHSIYSTWFVYIQRASFRDQSWRGGQYKTSTAIARNLWPKIYILGISVNVHRTSEKWQKSSFEKVLQCHFARIQLLSVMNFLWPLCFLALAVSASSAETCQKPEISASAYVTEDATVLTHVAFTTQFTLKCSNGVKGISLHAEIEGKSLPAVKLSADNKYQVISYFSCILS